MPSFEAGTWGRKAAQRGQGQVEQEVWVFGRLATGRELEQVCALRVLGASFLTVGEGRCSCGKQALGMNPAGPDRNRRCL